MQIIQNSYSLKFITHAIDKYFTENTLFFDIECTGLSPRKSFIYLIGYATRKDNEVIITQLLASNESEEIELLDYFENVIGDYDNLLGFNSTRFDESFIIERCRKYKLSTSIKSKNHIDMYLTTTKAKCLLDLPNYKQKTIEQYLGLDREDKYNGGELIPVYLHYSISRDVQSKELILLHNLEDIKGMVFACDILSYSDLLNSDITFNNSVEEGDRLLCTFNLPFALPKSINKRRDYGLYIIKDDIISLSLNTVHSSLYTFLPDCKNYYYLLNENIIIPKSIGGSVDKSNRRPATKRDCKVELTSDFIQLPEKLDIGTKIKLFKSDYDSKEAFIQPDDLSPAIATKILKYMFKH